MIEEDIKFLLVDDKDENLVALAALLRRDGLQLFKARSGSEALELLLEHEFALAILDVQMPEMDGFELAHLMRRSERTKHVPIMFVTAAARDPQRVFKGYGTGAVDFLNKPIDPQVLQSKVDVFFELARQRRALADALRLNELFVGILGHDLRSPLMAVMAGTDLLEHDNATPDDKRVIGRMRSAATRMTEMIEQLLDLTRARLAGGLGLAGAFAPVDLRSLVERTIEELRGTYPDVDLRVTSSGNTSISGDAGRLLQLFANLLGNALKHGVPGTTVELAIEGRSDEVIVTCANQGMIPAEILPVIFDPFRGRDSTAPKPRGLGLGLFISKQIAEAHGGKISVVSKESRTTFTVRLPRAVHRKPAGVEPRHSSIAIIDEDPGSRGAHRDVRGGGGHMER